MLTPVHTIGTVLLVRHRNSVFRDTKANVYILKHVL